jgi:hypothetical protein
MKKNHTVGSYGTYEEEEGIKDFGEMSNSYIFFFVGTEDIIRTN